MSKIKEGELHLLKIISSEENEPEINNIAADFMFNCGYTEAQAYRAAKRVLIEELEGSK